ncbi:alpha/beta hydrolase [Inconstantimicrobium mannanitabidum]|uniref:Uncharacterized protein n=1 Tax=Inconstantimicrobium mannanitabidum TaxID=1604901 RepID=A0ACB5R999_9CLOT|nr:alpha/beta hydrolase [Clostridium sp. TW13]GKX65599.1 hypothetical protein rsdtw13_08570 [Clostridium sp. TW13]
MKEYEQALLDELQQKTITIKNNGIDVIFKPSPGEDRPGYLDPRELNIMKEHWAGNMQQEPPKEPIPMEVLIPIMREFMGFANRNLNTVEIHTKYEELKESGNTVGLWRYYPRKSEKNRKRPAVVFIHGGGWIGGSVYTVENFCRLLAELIDGVVFNVDYSLAPEKPYPNGLNDNYYAVKHVYDHAEEYGIDPDKITVAGDSAGGNYTAAVCLKAREEGTPKIALQALIYPGVAIGDASVPGYEWSEDLFEISEEQKEIIKGCLMLGRPAKDASSDPMSGCYITNKEDMYNPYVSPMMAKSHADLPRALLFGAEFDGLRIQTEFYAKQLSDDGVPVTTFRYKGMTHAFIDKIGIVPQAEDLCIEIAKAIKEL